VRFATAIVLHLRANRIYRHATLKRRDIDVVALHRSRIRVSGVSKGDLLRICRRLRPAIVHTRNTSALDALLPVRLAGVAVCVHGEHGWDIDNLSGRKTAARRCCAVCILRSSTATYTVSKDLERYLVQTRSSSRSARIFTYLQRGRLCPIHAGLGRNRCICYRPLCAVRGI